MELVNVLKLKGASKEALLVLAKLIAPFAPHMAEEVWVEVLGQKFSVHTSSWPEYDEKYLEEKNSTIIIQVNGKLRSQMTVDKAVGSDKQKVEEIALKDEKVSKWLSGKHKVIFVPGKIINFVTS
jgi:leucyl-tRNA synthetase